MTRDEALEVTATTIREATRWAFGVWKSPAAIRATAAVGFVIAVASDEWDALEAGPIKSEEELAIEAIQADLKARGANGISEKAAKALYKARAHLKDPSTALPSLGINGDVIANRYRQASPALSQQYAKQRQERREADRKARFGQNEPTETPGESPEESPSNAQR